MGKKVFYFLAGFILLTQKLSAQNFNNALLWEISGNGLSQPSYIFGTIHMIDQKDFIVPAAVDSVFEIADQVYFELKMDDISMLSTFNNWIKLTEGKSLKDYCSNEEYIVLTKYVKDSLHTDINDVLYQKPFVIYQLQSANFIKGEMASFELYFVQKCMLQNIPIGGLETLQSQLAIFDSIPYTEQIDWIVEGIEEVDSNYLYYDQLIQYYLNADIINLADFMNETDHEFKKYGALLLDDRNIKWIPVIEQQIQKQSTFIAVGAGHLVGKNGVLQLLSKQGYTISPIK